VAGEGKAKKEQVQDDNPWRGKEKLRKSAFRVAGRERWNGRVEKEADFKPLIYPFLFS
jgi:hypothetical protein